MKKRKKQLKTGILLFGTSVLFWHCEQEIIEKQEPIIETVEIDEALTFLTSNHPSYAATAIGKQYTTPYVEQLELGQIYQEDIANSNASLTIVPASTVQSDHYSRLLLLKINNTIQQVVFSMFPSTNAGADNFSGEIIITDLGGNFLNGYRVANGVFVSQFKKQSTDDKYAYAQRGSRNYCPDHGRCTRGSSCVSCLQELDEIVIRASPLPITMPIFWLFLPAGRESGGGPNTEMSWEYSPDNGGGSTQQDPTPQDPNKPCAGNPVKNPEVAPQTVSGIRGGMFGWTRTGGTKFHNGLDLISEKGDPIYAMYDGTARLVTQVGKAGHYVDITSTINGITVNILYLHMQKGGRVSGMINAGDIIGYQGDSGNLKNAIIKGQAVSHLHIKVKENGTVVDPIPYLKTEIDPNTGQVINTCS